MKKITTDKLISGTIWLTISNIIGRLLGVVYIIPWYHWMGNVAPQANTLYSMGYNIYATILVLSTTGLNTAIAQQISKHNANNNHKQGLDTAKQFLSISIISGLVFSLLLYITAPLISKSSGSGYELVQVLRSLTLAVLVFPIMSVIRGIFQGYNLIKVNAISQLCEQFIRIIWMLITTFFIMNIGSKNYIHAVTQSTFAAFVGMIASVVILFYYLKKESLLHDLFKNISFKNYDWNIIKSAIKVVLPFIIAGSAIQIYQIIDQLTFVNMMSKFFNISVNKLNTLYAYISANPNKIIMMIVSIAVSISDTTLPLLTESNEKQDLPQIFKLINKNIILSSILLLPLIAGTLIISKPLYEFFYQSSTKNEINLFVLLIIQSLIQSIYIVQSTILNTLGFNKLTVKAFIIGIFIKLTSQIPLIYVLKEYGPIISTFISLIVPIVIMYNKLLQYTDKKLVKESVIKIGLNTAIMSSILLIMNLLLSNILGDTRFNHFVFITVNGIIGTIIYYGLSMKSNILKQFSN